MSLESLIGKSNSKDVRKVIFMLKYWKDGKEVIINPIYSAGQVGQVIILGEKVDWGESPNAEKYPLCQYPYLSLFTIVGISTHPEDKYYVLRDPDGKNFILKFGAADYLYNIKDWLAFNTIHVAEKTARKQRKIEALEGQVALLKDILIKQGVRIVTDAQAKILGIKT